MQIETATGRRNEPTVANEDDMPAPLQDEIEKWAAELAEIEGELARLNERKAMLQQVLETMPVIEKLRGNAPLVTEQPDSVEGEGTVSDSSPKLVNAISMVLQKYRKPMTPGQIKEHLKDVGFVKSFGETYFYTAVKRAVEKKAIVKKKDGRYVLAPPVINGVGYAA